MISSFHNFSFISYFQTHLFYTHRAIMEKSPFSTGLFELLDH
jgi:hypothetical protein